MKKLRWGIISTGIIARRFAGALAKSKSGRLQAVASRDPAKAREFAAQHKAVSAYGSYAELIADPEVDVIYIATPHPGHASLAVDCARAGRHILCEKPLTMNVREAEAVIEAARSAGVFLMEAFMYRCHPQIKELVSVLESGVIGPIRLIQATMGFYTEAGPESRLIARELGGGAILDVGCYPMSMARLVAGIGLGGRPAEPVSVKGSAVLHPQEKTDMVASATLEFPGGILAQLNASVKLPQDNGVRIFGERGSLVLNQPWFGDVRGASIVVRAQDGKIIREIPTYVDVDLYLYEIELTAASLELKQAPYPAMTWDDTLGNMRALELWLKEAGVEYD